MAGGVCMDGACAAGGMHGRGHAWWGMCMAGGMCGKGGVNGGGRVHGKGACMARGACMAGGVHGRRDGHCSGRYASY